MPKHILVTGANGQLGQELQKIVEIKEHHLEEAQFYFVDRKSLDITKKDNVLAFIKEHKIDTIINCAAYTAVDNAEEEKETAQLVNATAVKNLAELAKEKEIKLIHLSSDYVFDGKNHKPIREDEVTNPQGIYGQSKLDGEEAIRSIGPKGALIIRTSWIYSTFGHNFVHTMLKLGKIKNEINVVYDQIGTPTYAKNLAQVILTILEKNNNKEVITYHYSNEGSCSWYDFSQAIFELTNIKCKVNPIATDEYPTLAKRPHYSVLDKTKIKNMYALDIPYWRDSLKECLETMKC